MEWPLFIIALGLGLLLLAKRRRFGNWPMAALTGLILATLVSAKIYDNRTQRKSRSDAEFFASVPREGREDDYVSSAKCQSCHPSEYESWHRTFHRTMTQFARAESVVGDFNNVTLELLGKRFQLEKQGDEFWVEMEDPEWEKAAPKPNGFAFVSPPPAPRVRRRIGLLTGSHHMQVYWIPSRAGNIQLIFPFTWLMEDKRWAPFLDTFLRDPSIRAPLQSWNLNCINCHATGGQSRFNQQTGLLDTRAGELGIACEACHGPAEQHVQVNQSPLRRYLEHHSGHPDSTMVNPRRPPSKVSSQICGQCHGIKWILSRDDWNRRGFDYRPGRDLNQSSPLVRATQLDKPYLKKPLEANPTFVQDHYWSDGMVRVSGREYNGLVESACHEKGELACVSCHSLHNSKPDDQLARNMEGNLACLQCHSASGHDTPAHTHHRAGSSGSQCYNCHMPHTTYGLMKAIRSHQITSPTTKESLATGRPNACNLCHLDKTLSWTGEHLTEWYRQPPQKMKPEDETVSAALLWLIKGDAGQRALIAWHMGWEPARQTSGEKWLAPFLAQTLDDPYSAVRYIAHRSLKRLPGYQDLALDFAGPPAGHGLAKDRAMKIWEQSLSLGSDRTGPQILIDPTRGLDQERIQSLRQQRNNRSIDLQE